MKAVPRLKTALAGAVVFAFIVTVLLALVGLFIPEESYQPPRIDPVVADLLPPEVPTDTVERLWRRRATPDIIELDVRVDGATSLFLVYPPLFSEPMGGRSTMSDVDSVLAYTTGGSLAVERGVPMNILPSDCGASCAMQIRLVDARDVHFFSDGSLDLAETPILRVPTEIVLAMPIDPPIERDSHMQVDVCVDGFDVSGEQDGLGRFVTLQRRRPDQVGPAQLSLWYGRGESLHERASSLCQVEFRIGAQTWGSKKEPVLYDEIVVNVVHWGEIELDDFSSVTATAVIVPAAE